MKPQPIDRFRRWFRRLVVLLLLAVLMGCGMVGYAYFTAAWASRGRLFNEVSELPMTQVGLVFGTTARIGVRENLYFRYRIDAAEKVWKSGKIKTLIVSGDNRRSDYNEPEKMKQALVARGIPSNRIVCDYAGLRTLDSVVRAKEIFGTDSILFISQRFQNERAIYLAKAHGLDARGYNAQDIETPGGRKTHIREIAARVQMWLDINIYHTRPIHLGKKITLPP